MVRIWTKTCKECNKTPERDHLHVSYICFTVKEDKSDSI